MLHTLQGRFSYTAAFVYPESCPCQCACTVAYSFCCTCIPRASHKLLIFGQSKSLYITSAVPRCFSQTCQAVPALLLPVDCSHGHVCAPVYTLFDMAQRACAWVSCKLAAGWLQATVLWTRASHRVQSTRQQLWAPPLLSPSWSLTTPSPASMPLCPVPLALSTPVTLASTCALMAPAVMSCVVPGKVTAFLRPSGALPLFVCIRFLP